MGTRDRLSGSRLAATTSILKPFGDLGSRSRIVRATLRIDPSREASDAAVAAKLIECAELGMRDPEALSEHILALIGGPRPASPA